VIHWNAKSEIFASLGDILWGGVRKMDGGYSPILSETATATAAVTATATGVDLKVRRVTFGEGG